MTAIPKFEEDIFISYAHIDNVPLSEGLKGWVETLHERLRIRLNQLLGEEVRVWRDTQLKPHVPFPEELPRQIANVAIFVSILSPRYCRAEWCLRELTKFWESDPEHKSRVFKVVKTQAPLENHPSMLQGLLGYEFYEFDERGRPIEFNAEIGPPRDFRYWAKFEDLAWDIKQLIDTIRRPHQPSIGKAIYLAETTRDLRQERDGIKRELQQHGYAILPDQELPLEADLFRDTVRRHLSGSAFSIHLIGDRYGIIPEGESKSIVHLQCDLAAERNGSFEQIIWMPIELQAQDEAQQRLIDSLRQGGHRDVELLQTKLEDLKTFIHEKIADQPRQTVDPNSVYLICDRQDLAATQQLEDYLDDLGFRVILPATEGKETQLLDEHKMNLLECDAVLIYYGHANEIWLRMKLRELQKLAGYGRTTPLLAKGIFISAPRTDAKERIRDHEAVIIKNYEGFSPESLKPFLERMRQARGASR